MATPLKLQPGVVLHYGVLHQLAELDRDDEVQIATQTALAVGQEVLMHDDANRLMCEGVILTAERRALQPVALAPGAPRRLLRVTEARILLRRNTLGPASQIRRMGWERRAPFVPGGFNPDHYQISCPEVVAGLGLGDGAEFQRRLMSAGLQEMGPGDLALPRQADPDAGHAAGMSELLRAAANV